MGPEPVNFKGDKLISITQKRRGNVKNYTVSHGLFTIFAA